ncbi:unnamed protein product, partial [Prunus brigantina]
GTTSYLSRYTTNWPVQLRVNISNNKGQSHHLCKLKTIQNVEDKSKSLTKKSFLNRELEGLLFIP